MKKTKMEKGITLIALIITIVVLLILAVVAINAIIKDDILERAEKSALKYNQSVENEQEVFDGYLEKLEGSAKIADEKGNDVRNKVLSTTQNTEVYDKYGNKIVVPAGFKIVVNADTNNADTVTKGIVIEDCTEAETKGSQFVWIPVGKIYTDTERTEENAKTITLGRYEDFTATDGVYTPAQNAEDYATATSISYADYLYTEDTASNHNSSYGNAIARNIGAFVTSATQNCGYYIGRYEAGDSSNTEFANRIGNLKISTAGTLVCKANQVPYNYITQTDASNKCQSMYSSGTFTSDLINSYAWDTAIIFIQTFGTKSNSGTYASTAGKSTTAKLQKTGTQILESTSSVDEQLNIYDMAGNCMEYTTENSGNSNPYVDVVECYVKRGGYFETRKTTDYRNGWYLNVSIEAYAFRPVVYVDN